MKNNRMVNAIAVANGLKAQIAGALFAVCAMHGVAAYAAGDAAHVAYRVTLKQNGNVVSSSDAVWALGEPFQFSSGSPRPAAVSTQSVESGPQTDCSWTGESRHAKWEQRITVPTGGLAVMIYPVGREDGAVATLIDATVVQDKSEPAAVTFQGCTFHPGVFPAATVVGVKTMRVGESEALALPNGQELDVELRKEWQ
ncbi:hypothetical protein [Paraburkholderia sp. J8-2]|uniref:hypothetical protein n=1 Tax=Paraburkholderia sp. J8-2 TaxID=2805440 RepID=UPI002AB74E54|nr:hypothetical protein [Paraburkholderia sp. J8-2]